jgi:hypothetical protein
MKCWKSVITAGIVMLFLTGPARAYYDEYDDSQAHPLRIAAYILHPVGFALEWLVTRPIHALVSQPELEPVFGHTPHGWELDYDLPGGSTVTTTLPPPSFSPAGSTVDTDAARRAADEARASAEEAKRAAEAAARAAQRTNREFEKSLNK